MRRIRVIEAIAGADFSWAPGDVVEVSEEEAASWADGHRAELADPEDEQVPVQQAPRVVTADGQDLVVVAAVIEEFDAPGADPGSPAHARWAVTVELPTTTSESPEPKEAAVFDPAEHKVDEVLEYLASADEEEAARVLDAEAAAKKPRASIVNVRDDLLAAARERTTSGEQQIAEKAAEASRGGGRGDEFETRQE